jgi:hypothetical protein
LNLLFNRSTPKGRIFTTGEKQKAFPRINEKKLWKNSGGALLFHSVAYVTPYSLNASWMLHEGRGLERVPGVLPDKR